MYADLSSTTDWPAGKTGQTAIEQNRFCEEIIKPQPYTLCFQSPTLKLFNQHLHIGGFAGTVNASKIDKAGNPILRFCFHDWIIAQCERFFAKYRIKDLLESSALFLESLLTLLKHFG